MTSLQCALLGFGLVLTACGTPGRDADATGDRPPPDTPPVLAGVDVLVADGAGPLAGRRVGLITNHTGVARDGRSTIDILHEHSDLELVSLFGPEHGLRGTAEAGEHIVDGMDARTGLPVHSLYGERRAPTPEMLADIDALVFDIQDVGSRYYTYVWTMTESMQAAAAAGVRFVVLDRPDPIGGELVQGNVLDPAFATFVGLYPVPMRHGMTVGEMARFVNTEFAIGADLHVVPLRGWRRTQWFDETGLRWLAPSPNMPDLESATHYPGTCLFEGTNLSVGRGTSAAFQQIGAPWLDAGALVERLRTANLPGIRVDTVSFTPAAPGDGKYDGVAVRGVRFTATDRTVYDPARTAVVTLVALRALHADSLRFLESHFDRLAGSDALRNGILAGADAATLTVSWDAQVARFRALRQPSLLYD